MVASSVFEAFPCDGVFERLLQRPHATQTPTQERPFGAVNGLLRGARTGEAPLAGEKPVL